MKKINEIGIGAFRPGADISGNINHSIGRMSPTSNADTVISQRQSKLAYEQEEDLEEEEEDILEHRVHDGFKYCLLETLEKLNEKNINADDINIMADKLKNQNRDIMNNMSNMKTPEEHIEDALDEFSGSAAIGGGPAVPLGYTAKGKPETKSQRKKRQTFNIKKSYPYTKLANPPKSLKKRRKK